MCVCVVLLYSYQLGGQGSPLSTTEYLLSSTQLSYNQLSVGTPSIKVKEKKREVLGGWCFREKGKGWMECRVRRVGTGQSYEAYN